MKIDNSISKSFILSFVFHIILIVIFSFILHLPSFDQNINLKPVNIELQSDLNFSQTNAASQTHTLKQEEKKIVQKSIEKNIDIKSEKSESKSIDSKKLIDKSIQTENKPLITPIESKKEEEQQKDIITTSQSDSSNIPSSTQTNDSQDSSSDDIVQQLLTSGLQDESSQNSKDNIQWNSGVNRWTVKKIKPILPKKYQEKGNTISCKIYIEINKFGSVISAIIVQSTGYPDLDQYIISIIKDWKFNQVTYDKVDSGYITIIFVVS